MRRIIYTVLTVIMISMVIFSGCSAPVPETSFSVGAPPAPTIVPAPAPAQAPRTDEDYSGKKGATTTLYSGGDTSTIDRMIVRTGDMSMVVVDVSYVINEIAIIAEKLDGYVVSSQKWGERDRLHGAITIRVPAGDFTNVITELHKLAVEVTNEQTSSEDVTEEYVDLEAKLRNLEASELQLVKLLDKAEKVEDILGIQRELTRTRGEIDQTQGRMQYLERTSSTSLIRVTLEQAALDVIITANKKTVKEGERIQFESRIAGGFAPYSFEWDFGDEETSTDPYPIHSYKADGIYTITLTVTDDRSNSAAEIREDYIDVLPGWTAGLTASGAWKGLVTFGHVLVDIFIWLGVFSPVWIIIGGILFWWFRRKKKKIM